MAHLFDDDDPMAMYQAAMMQRAAGGRPQRFDEYYRCYPVAMLSGPDRPEANHGGKVFLPPSALEKLMRLHIAYPMLFELLNGKSQKKSHAGVLEFVAEEGKIYLPQWLMQTLHLEVGDLLRVKSTDLPPGRFIKVQAQSTDFLDITDHKAVLERAFMNFSCLTVGDIFTFSYNDHVYEVGVKEVKPDKGLHAIVTMETDLEVDFEAPVGYEELVKTQEEAKVKAKMQGGTIHTEGSMAKAINYASIAPKKDGETESSGSVNFGGAGNRLGTKKGSRNATGTSTPSETPPAMPRSLNGVQPLRLPPNKLFLGFPYVPPKNKDHLDDGDADKAHFKGQGQTLRGRK